MDKPTTIFAGFGDVPELEPVISHEVTDYGWRGLTGDGEVLEVRNANGHKVDVPNEITVALRGKAIGVRPVHKPPALIDIEEYLEHFNDAVDAYKNGELAAALLFADAAIALAPTLRARFNRSMILLASGNWREGFDEYIALEQHAPFIRPQVKQALEAGLRPWRGENINGMRILIQHAHGFGDTIQCLRYISSLQAMGAEVVLQVPDELATLASQHATVSPSLVDADYFCPILHLLGRLHVSPVTCMDEPYLTIGSARIEKWRGLINSEKKTIGIAWSVGKPSAGDYPRTLELEQFVAGLDPEADLYSVQSQRPPADSRVKAFDFEDFADCAALMMCCDEIVTVDTAAVHLAGAIGHPNVKLLLSKWASWRWIKNWYLNVKVCRQTSDGDWASALAQI
jgi:hypothetical protein